MYSKSFFFALQKFTRLSLFLGFQSAEFSIKTLRYEYKKLAKIKLRLRLLRVISYLLLLLFFLFRTIQLFFEGKSRENGKVNNSFYAICAAHCFLFVQLFGAVVHGFWFQTRFHRLLNRNISYVMEFQSKLLPSFK